MNPIVPGRLGAMHYCENCKRSCPISRLDIAQLESEIGSRLPEEYAEFLLLHPLGPVAFGTNGIFCRNENGRRVWLGEFYSIVEGMRVRASTSAISLTRWAR